MPVLPLLAIDSLAVSAPDHGVLFSRLTLSVGAERVGLVGRNGSGKSTLLRILAGSTEPSAGSVVCIGTVGVLAQEWEGELSISAALGVASGLAVIERILAGDGEVDDFVRVDWSLSDRIDAALSDVGLRGVRLDRRMGSLSGGERTRVGLARLLIEAPDFLLLDEPTNNLDMAGRRTVASFLAGWRGGAVVASHDRTLLEQMDRIVELSPASVRIVGGGWSAFVEARAADRERAAMEFERAEAALRDARRVSQRKHESKQRRDKTGRSSAASGSEPRILLGRRAERAENTAARLKTVSQRQETEASGRLEAARRKVEIVAPLRMDLPPLRESARTEQLRFDCVTVSFGERAIGPWTFSLRGAERLAVVGPNGSGKTTLLRVAAGDIVPSAGVVRRTDARIAMLDQHVSLLAGEASVLANVRRLNPTLDDEAAHAVCARFMFRNREALRLARELSGGERLRAGLACALGGAKPPSLLILDEPTNHLDLDAIEALEGALSEFGGALLLVSHDPVFLKAVGVTRSFRL